ncbi:MAG: hypothetical protein ACLFSA_03550, partial [Spirochaetaceae bacterium]
IKGKYRLFLVFFIFSSPLLLPAVDYYEAPMEPINPRFSAMGGSHTAMHDGFSSLFQNPAGLLMTEEEISFAELTFGLKGPVFTIADTFLGGAELEDISDLLDGLYTGLDLTGPLSFGYVGEGLGLGVFTTTTTEIKSNNPLSAKERIAQDILFTGGYAFPIIGEADEGADHRLDGGVLLKGGFRGKIEGGVAATELLSPSLDLLLGRPFYFTSLIGADVGLLYSYKDKWYAGLTGKDVFTPTLRSKYNNISEFLDGVDASKEEFGVVPFTLNLGGMYRWDLEERNIFISEVKALFDYSDILDFWLYPRQMINPVLHVGLGAEVTILQILDLRLGFSQGLPTAGLGLDLHFFTLNAAIFGTERSTEPGMSPVYNLQFGFQFTK